LVGPRELAASPAYQEDGRKTTHGKPLRSGERRSSFEAANVALELAQTEQTLNFPEEEKDYSSTLKAIRRAYELAAIEARDAGRTAEWEQYKARELAYYLV
jgi:hypothetical protein